MVLAARQISRCGGVEQSGLQDNPAKLKCEQLWATEVELTQKATFIRLISVQICVAVSAFFSALGRDQENAKKSNRDNSVAQIAQQSALPDDLHVGDA